MDSAYIFGFTSFEDGLDLDNNPYELFTSQYYSYIEGWMDAQDAQDEYKNIRI